MKAVNWAGFSLMVLSVDRGDQIERLRLQFPHARDGVNAGHLGLGEHLLLHVQDAGVDLIGHQRRNVLGGDADEVHVLRVDLGGAKHGAAVDVGKAARLLDADTLAFEIGHCRNVGPSDHRGFELGRIDVDDASRRALGDADDGQRTGRHTNVGIACQHRAIDLDAAVQRDGLHRDAVLLVKPEVLGDQHRHVHDVGRARRHGDHQVFGAGHGRQCQHRTCQQG